MKKRTPLLMLLAAAMMHMAGLSAKQRTFNEAYSIAELQARRLGIAMDAASLAKAKSLNSLAVSGKPVAYYVFPNGENKGFTIVSGDDRLPEIVGYSDSGTYSDGNQPEAYKAFLEMYQNTVNAALNGNADAAKSVAQARQRAQGVNGKVKVEPLLGGIMFNQDSPYNKLCPLYDGTYHSVTGCTATAIAQVLAYWKYPATLQADIPAYTTDTRKIRVDGISKGEAYDWEHIRDSYGYNEDFTEDYTEEEALAVAKLMLHCGAAVRMDYGPVSGAFVSEYPLIKYFGYDADLIANLSRHFYSLDEWCGLLDAELKAGRPMLYSGGSSESAHQFVCDGADGKGFYHINWGWNGHQDGYFDISILNPQKGSIGSGSADDGYSRDCNVIIGIQPDNGIVDEPLIDVPSIIVYAWDKTDRSVDIKKGTRTNANGTFKVNVSDRFCNYSMNAFSGCYGYGVKEADGSYKLVSSDDYTEGTLRGRTEDFDVQGAIINDVIDYAFPVGRTTVYSVFSKDGVTWKRCHYLNEHPMVFEATATSLSYLETTLTGSVSSDDTLLSDGNNPLTLTLTNTGDEEFEGVLNIYGSGSDACPSKAATTTYAVIPAHATVTQNITLAPTAGTYRVWVKDAATDAVVVDGQRFDVEQAGTPDLSLVSVSTNAEPGLYESELAYYHNVCLQMPKTNDAEAVFTYGVKNSGGTAMFDYCVAVSSYQGDNFKMYSGSKKMPGNGAVTYITTKCSPADFGGDRSFFASLVYGDSYESLPTSLSGTSLPFVDEPGESFSLEAEELAVYVAGDVETGLNGASSLADGLYVRGGKGEIEIASGSDRTMAVYAADGCKVRTVNVAAGSVERVSVEAGLYIVGGRKVVVK